MIDVPAALPEWAEAHRRRRETDHQLWPRFPGDRGLVPRFVPVSGWVEAVVPVPGARRAFAVAGTNAILFDY